MTHIKLNRKEFLKKLQIVETAVNDDKSNVVESVVRFEIIDNKLVLKSNSLDLYVKAELECSLFESGEFMIKPKLMVEYLNSLQEEEIEIKEKDNKLQIISGKSISTFGIYEFENVADPNLPTNIPLLEYKFDKNEFLEDIENVKFAAAITSDKQAVNCIRMELEDNKIEYVATDFHKLICITKKLERNVDESLSVSIPLRSINGLIKIIKLVEDKEILFKSEGTKVLFKFDDVEILTKVVDIQYPDYKRLLSTVVTNKKALVNTKMLQNILRRISFFVKDNKDRPHMGIFRFKKDNLEIIGESELAFLNEKVNINYEDADIEIGINVKYITDFLNTISEEDFIEINLNSRSKPVIINVLDRKDIVYLVAPTSI